MNKILFDRIYLNVPRQDRWCRTCYWCRGFMLWITVSLSLVCCTDLEETYDGNLTQGQVDTLRSKDANALFDDLNRALRKSFQNPLDGVFIMSELSTDELIIPTRGGDWDDNGIWRQLHQHRWNADNWIISGCFNNLNGVVYTATDLLREELAIDDEQAAEVRFHRAWAMYWLLDLFDQVPYRDPGESTLKPARVRKGMEALDYIINEIETIKPLLNDGPPQTVTISAANALLMKCYLNKGVYLNRESPAFSAGDMDKVVSLADEIIALGRYTFSQSYFDNFAPNNAEIGLENIFTMENKPGIDVGGLVFMFTFLPKHYSEIGINGFTTLSNFFDSFEETDKRRGEDYHPPSAPPNPSQQATVGLLSGQRYDRWSGEPLTDGINGPLIYSSEVKIIESGPGMASAGIRPVKYDLDFDMFYQGSILWNNDWVHVRLPDVLLMKAEAMMRGGKKTDSGPFGSTEVDIVNAIRTHPSRNASALSTLTMEELLAERQRELWLECWRRQDLIRFQKFLGAFQEKDPSTPLYLVYPIPNQQLAVNPNLTRTPGY